MIRQSFQFVTIVAVVAAVTIPADRTEAGGPPKKIELKTVVSGLTAPLDMACPDDGTKRMFIADQVGKIVVVDAKGQVHPKPMLDVTKNMTKLSARYDERGLLGIALHPDYAKNGRFFVYYTGNKTKETPSGYNCEVVIAEFKVSKDDPNVLDPESEKVILTVATPQSNHNGGGIRFGPDGFLYISIGDGGAANDSGGGHNPKIGNAQDMTSYLGKILRIDVNSGSPYSVPKDNPFVGKDNAKPEIWAFGIRNAWRFSFDRGGKHELFAGDVGQNTWEEIDIITRGGNYGWRVREGNHYFDPATGKIVEKGPASDANGSPFIDPIMEYHHLDQTTFVPYALSICGGYVYRGKSMPEMEGHYLFGDWSGSWQEGKGQLFVGVKDDKNAWTMHPLIAEGREDSYLGVFLLSIGEDLDGELYALTSENLGPMGKSGKVQKITMAAK